MLEAFYLSYNELFTIIQVQVYCIWVFVNVFIELLPHKICLHYSPIIFVWSAQMACRSIKMWSFWQFQVHFNLKDSNYLCIHFEGKIVYSASHGSGIFCLVYVNRNCFARLKHFTLQGILSILFDNTGNCPVHLKCVNYCILINHRTANPGYWKCAVSKSGPRCSVGGRGWANKGLDVGLYEENIFPLTLIRKC